MAYPCNMVGPCLRRCHSTPTRSVLLRMPPHVSRDMALHQLSCVGLRRLSPSDPRPGAREMLLESSRPLVRAYALPRSLPSRPARKVSKRSPPKTRLCHASPQWGVTHREEPSFD